MAAEDYIDFEEDRDWEEPSQCCQKCGSPNLYWEYTANGWRLFDFAEERPHVCPPIDPALLFEDLGGESCLSQ